MAVIRYCMRHGRRFISALSGECTLCAFNQDEHDDVFVIERAA